MQEKQEQEEIFLKNINLLEKIEDHVKSMVENYEEGMTELAFSRFQDESKGISLSAQSYTPTPALLTVKYSEDQGNDMKIQKTKVNQLKDYLPIEGDIDYSEKEYQQKQKQLIKDIQEKHEIILKKKNQSSNQFDKVEDGSVIEPLENFAFDKITPGIKRSQKLFGKSLEHIIEIANLINTLKLQKQQQQKKKSEKK